MTLENSPAPKEGQMMKVGHPSKLRVLLIALIFSAVMILGQTKRADATTGLDDVLVVYTVFAVVAAVAIIAMAISVACKANAAAKPSNHPGGSSGIFGDCFTFDLSNQTTPAGENEEEDEGWDQD